MPRSDLDISNAQSVWQKLDNRDFSYSVDIFCWETMKIYAKISKEKILWKIFFIW